MDGFDRPLVRRALLAGNYQWLESRYDARGLRQKVSIPCFSDAPTSSCANAWTEFAYDSVGRLKSVTRPSSEGSQLVTTNLAYLGFKTTSTDPLGKSTSQIVDPLGLLRASTDANGYTQNFQYDSAGSLLGVTDGVRTLFEASYEYGVGPFQVSAKSYAQSSRTAYRYDGLGQLRRWTDPKGQHFEMTYDALSRPKKRRDGVLSATSQEAETNWDWGRTAALHNIGQLAGVSMSSVDGTYQELYDYDDQGRLSTQTINLPGDSNAYVYGFGYNGSTGLLETLMYPASTSGSRFALKFNAPNGTLQSIVDANSPSTVYWSLYTDADAPAMNALGRIAREWMGNTIARKREFDAVTGSLERQTAGPSNNLAALQNESFGYDLVGNLQQRQNSLGSLPAALSEDFTNVDDNLYRFKTGTVRANGAVTATYNVTQYDDIGNIQHEDATGTIPAPVDQTISWTSYNYPKTITAPWQNESVSFSYGPDRDRWRMVYQQGSSTETTYYLGGLMEKVITASGATEYRHYIPGPEDIIGIHTRSGSSTTTRYLLTDHLGSVDTIFDSGGSKIASESFTAYGLPRNSDTWSGAASSAGDSVTRQGYTFQTVLGKLGLNHMNGRVQDAMTGTFLSPDPFVPDPSDTQSFNRYAYVRNDPMTSIDPSGFIDFNSNQGCDGCMFGMVGEVGSSGPGINYDVIEFYGGFNSLLGSMGIAAIGPDCHNTQEYCWRQYNQQQQQQNTPPAVQISWSRMESTAVGACGGSPGLCHLGPDQWRADPLTRIADIPLLSGIDYGLGWLFQGARSGPVRGAFSNSIYSERQLADAKMGIVLAAGGPLTSGAGAMRQAVDSLRGGQLVEAAALRSLGLEKATSVFRPSAEQVNSAAFRLIVGTPRYTKGGVLRGTILDSEGGGFSEFKSGSSPLRATYQIRLQLYRALTEGQTYTIYSNRPVTVEFADWFDRWGGSLQPLP